jgi:hypothetical protein
MADGTLKSFLVDIGFRVDNATLTKLHASLKQAGDAANQFGAYIIKQTTALTQATAAQRANTTATTAGTAATAQATTVGQQQLAMLNQINTAIQGLTTQMQHNHQAQQRAQQSARATGAAWSLLKTAAIGMSTAFVGMGWAIERSLVRVNDNFENLFFMAQRTGVAVGRLQDVIFANKQVGISAEQSKASLEKLAIAWRDNPGRKEWIDQALLHGQTSTDPADQIAKMEVEYRRILNLPAGIKANAEYAFRAQATAQGFDVEQLRQKALNPTGPADEAWHKNMRNRMGLGDAEAIAKQARAFETEWGKATASVQSAWTRLTVAVTPFATTVATVISDALVEIAPDIDDLGKRLRVALEEFAGKDGKNLKDTIQPWINDFKDWVKSLDEDKLRQFGRDLRLLLDILWGIGKTVVVTAQGFEWLSSHIGGTMAALTFFFGYFLAKAALVTAAAWGMEAAFKGISAAAAGMWRGATTSANPIIAPGATPTAAARPSFWGRGGFLAGLGRFTTMLGIGGLIGDEITSNPEKYPHLQPGYMPDSVRRRIEGKPAATAPIPSIPEGTSHYLGAEDAGSEGGGPAGGGDYGGGAAARFGRGETAASLLREMLNRLSDWWAGSAGYSPMVTLAQEYYDKLHDMLRELLGEFGFQATGSAAASVGGGAGGPGGGGPGGGGPGGGGPGDGGGGPAGGPPGASPNIDPKKGNLRNQAIDYFVSKGWTRAQAAGIAASIETESSWRSNAVGDGGKAYGLGQWHPDRQANFKKVFGHDIRQSTFGEQLAFFDWELRNTEHKAGDRLHGATTARQAGSVVSQYFERPRDVQGNATARGNLAESINQKYTPGAPPPSATPAATPTGSQEMSATERARILAQYPAGVLQEMRKRGMIGPRGIPTMPPGFMKLNSRGELYAAEMDTVPKGVLNATKDHWFPKGYKFPASRLGTDPKPGPSSTEPHGGGGDYGGGGKRSAADSKYQVTINVHGVSDQAGTAEATLAAIRRHEQQFLRNNRTAVV